jgi:response regulator of citrate/malate metabolism
MSTKKILIVEDDKMLCTIFEMFIKELGHELIGFARKGDEAIKICGEVLPDIILMDIILEGEKDGIETAQIIADKYDIPIIYISSNIDDSTLQKATLANTYGFLVKPLYKTTLGVAIEFACSKHKLDQKLRKS